MPKLVLLLIPILALVLFGLTAWGYSDSRDRITVLEAVHTEHAEQLEFLEEVAKFAYNCANIHTHHISGPVDEYFGTTTTSGKANGSQGPDEEYPDGLEHCSNTFYTSVYAENNAQLE